MLLYLRGSKYGAVPRLFIALENGGRRIIRFLHVYVRRGNSVISASFDQNGVD